MCLARPLLPRVVRPLTVVALLAPSALARPLRAQATQPAQATQQATQAGAPTGAPTGPLWDSYDRAAAVVRAALAAHGGEAAVRGLAAAAYRWEGEDYAPSQGRVPSAAWDTAGNARPAADAVRLDLARGRYAWDREFRFGGGYLNAIRVAADGRTLVAYNPEAGRGMGGTTFTRDTTGVAARRTLLALSGTMPVLLLREAVARASTLRYLGASVAGGRCEEVVAFTGADGESVTLYVDSATHRISRREELGVGTLGDEIDAYHFSDYRTVGGLAVPHRLDVRWNGLLTGRRRLVGFAAGAAVAATLGDSLVAVPAGYIPTTPAGPPAVVPVADGVYYLERLGGAYRMLVVDTGDGVLVVDPPLAPPVGEAALALVERTLPGRPVRWVVLTHHHADHIGGLPAFAARGATVLVAPGSEAYIRRMAAAARTIGQFGATAGAPAARPLALRTVHGALTVGTGPRAVRVLDVGPTSHAAAMLAVHVPAARLLFQGDLLRINAAGGPAAAPDAARDLERVLRLAPGVASIGAVHGINGTPDDVRAARARGDERRAAPPAP
jgi:glyoxylase-like metal-dependent hydrolase (beta-lactamase superfamily II)